MGLLVDQLAVEHRHNLVYAVCKLIAAILDMDAAFAMGDIASINISETRHGS
jgi:hypothetical protein